MARIKITGPDGRIAYVTPPPGATEEQIQSKIDELKGSWGGQQPPQAAQRSWSDIPGEAIRNAPESAGRFAGNILEAITSPVQTGKNLIKVGLGALENVAPYPEWAPDYEAVKPRMQGFEQAADATGQFFKDRYGSLEGLKNTLATDPVGAAADAATVLTGGGALAGRLPGVAGQVGNAASRAGGMIDPIQAAGRTAALAGRGASHVLGMTTGAGAQPVQAAFRAGRKGNEAFPSHMRGQAPMRDVVDMADSGLDALKSARRREYEAGTQATKASTSLIDYAPIRSAVQTAFNDATYMGLAKDADALRAVEEIATKVKAFESLPYDSGKIAQGLDALKQSIGEISQRAKPGTLAQRVASNVYNAVKAQIADQVPSYAKAMQRYSDASDQIKDLQKTFSLNPNAASETTLRKLQSVTRNNVNTSYGERANMLDVLAKTEPDLPYALAGQALNSATPRGLQGLTAGGAGVAGVTSNPMALATLPAFSPRVVGEAAFAAGKGARLSEKAIKALGGPQKAAKALLAARAAGELSMTDEQVKAALDQLRTMNAESVAGTNRLRPNQ